MFHWTLWLLPLLAPIVKCKVPTLRAAEWRKTLEEKCHAWNRFVAVLYGRAVSTRAANKGLRELLQSRIKHLLLLSHLRHYAKHCYPTISRCEIRTLTERPGANLCNCKTSRNIREGSYAAESCEHIACILGFNKEIAVIALAPGVSAFI